MNFAYIQGAARYHTPGDSIANLDRASLQHHGANMLGLTRALGNTDLATLAANHDVTYFLGSVIIYPTALVWPPVLLAVIVLAGLVALTRRGRLRERFGVDRSRSNRAGTRSRSDLAVSAE